MIDIYNLMILYPHTFLISNNYPSESVATSVCKTKLYLFTGIVMQCNYLQFQSILNRCGYSFPWKHVGCFKLDSPSNPIFFDTFSLSVFIIYTILYWRQKYCTINSQQRIKDNSSHFQYNSYALFCTIPSSVADISQVLPCIAVSTTP